MGRGVPSYKNDRGDQWSSFHSKGWFPPPLSCKASFSMTPSLLFAFSYSSHSPLFSKSKMAALKNQWILALNCPKYAFTHTLWPSILSSLKYLLSLKVPVNYCQLTIHFYFPSYRLTVVRKAFEGNTDLVEEWYGTEYSIHKIPSENIEVREYHQFKLSFCTLWVRSRSTNCHVLCILLVKIPFYWCVRRI